MKLIANRSRQRGRPQLGRDRLDPVFLDRRHYARLCAVKKSITTRLCSSVLSKIVEWFEPAITCRSAFGIAFVDRFLPCAVGALVPGRHQVLVAAEHERG